MWEAHTVLPQPQQPYAETASEFAQANNDEAIEQQQQERALEDAPPVVNNVQNNGSMQHNVFV